MKRALLWLFGPAIVVVTGCLAWAIIDHYLGPFGTRHAW